MAGSSGKLRTVFLCAALFLASGAGAQTISGNVFSPYTMYGLGEMSVAGDAATRSMGGIGIASREMITPNAQTPAAYSVMGEKSVLFAVGVQNSNNYLREGGLRSSNNAVMLSNVNFQFRIAKGIGFGMSLTPYSGVGYRIKRQETDPGIIAEVGDVSYRYSGSGGINQLKAGVGVALTKHISVGVNYIYYLGNITHSFNTDIYPYLPPTNYRTVASSEKLQINQSSFEVGLQYYTQLKEGHYLNAGLIYQPHIVSRTYVDRVIRSSDSNVTDTVKYSSYGTNVRFPAKYGVGLQYENRKVRIGIDYIYQDFKEMLEDNYHTYAGASFKGSHDVRLGMQIVPNRFDIRRVMNRWSYRLGVRYTRSYLEYENRPLDEIALSLGLGIPIQGSAGAANVNVGAEVGNSGFAAGQISNTYFRVFVGVNFFSANEWFKRHRFR